MRILLVAALLAGCHHTPPPQAPTPAPIAAQPVPQRGPGRADVDAAPGALPLAETVITTRPCIEPTSDPLPTAPNRTGALHVRLDSSRCERHIRWMR